MSLFLKQTLTRVKLHEILATRPVAVNHLVTYLQKRKSYQELSDLLTSSGRYDEAGVVLYQHALTLKGADERVRRIKGIYWIFFGFRFYYMLGNQLFVYFFFP